MIYDFGGFYFDLDNRVLKPIDVWRYLGPAFLHHAPYENVFFWYGFDFPNTEMSTIGSRPGHPLFKQLIDNKTLDCFYKQNPKSPVYSTGPRYLDTIYQSYMKEYFGEMAPENDVQIVHPK